MAPREVKETPKVQRALTKTNTTKRLPIVPNTKNTMSTKKIVEATPRKENATAVNLRQRTKSATTPKSKENKTAPCPGSVSKSAKKGWNRRPKPAHSGVPVPEKMKRILQQQLQDAADSNF